MDSRAPEHILLLSGVITLVASIIVSSSILAFIGLGLTFWGTLLLYIRPARYVKASILDATALTPLEAIDQIITELNYQGKAVHLPPRYATSPKGGKLFIAAEKNLSIPSIAEVATGKVFLENPKGMCLTPPGVDLANLYGHELGKDFTQVRLSYLRDNLPHLFVEDLGIAEDLEINASEKTVNVAITGSVHGDLHKHVGKLSSVRSGLGCPICSSIAIILTRVSQSPVVIEETEVSKDGKTTEVHFQLLEPVELERPAEPQVEALLEQAVRLYRNRLVWNLTSSFLTVLGLITLAWVGYLIWYDITFWSKDIALILFQDRTIEPYSLGIGLRIIHYLVIGLALLFSGLLAFLRTRRSRV